MSVTSDGQIEIRFNEKGRDLLVTKLQALNARNDHIHLAEQSAMFGDIELSVLAYDPADTSFKCGKIYFRTDEWDQQYFPHVVGDARLVSAKYSAADVFVLAGEALATTETGRGLQVS